MRKKSTRCENAERAKTTVLPASSFAAYYTGPCRFIVFRRMETTVANRRRPFGGVESVAINRREHVENRKRRQKSVVVVVWARFTAGKRKMGKGYNNYMCKKPFHPGSKANIKRAWMAEQQADNDKKKQEELKLQYDKEQDLYNNKALLSKESKEKLGLNFMYEAPPGAKKERQKEDDEPEYKFEWQRRFNAPREDFAKGNSEIRDQPFGIQVRNVRCIRCHKWGHINTDRECPLYNKGLGLEAASSMDPIELMRRMKEEEGLALKQSILGHKVDPSKANQQLVESDEEEEDIETEFLKSLSTKQKMKLLKKLERMEQKSNKLNKKMKSSSKEPRSKKKDKSKKSDRKRKGRD